MKKIIVSIAVIALVALFCTSCNKVCTCTVKSGDIVLEGYENIAVGEMPEDDCTGFQDDTWNTLGYTYTCVSE